MALRGHDLAARAALLEGRPARRRPGAALAETCSFGLFRRQLEALLARARAGGSAEARAG